MQASVQEDPLEKEMATHSSIRAWKISWTESLVDYSLWGCKELDMTEHVLMHNVYEIKATVVLQCSNEDTAQPKIISK